MQTMLILPKGLHWTCFSNQMYRSDIDGTIMNCVPMEVFPSSACRGVKNHTFMQVSGLCSAKLWQRAWLYIMHQVLCLALPILLQLGGEVQ